MTAVLDVPVTEAVNCWGGEEGVRETEAGATEMVTGGIKLMLAVDRLLGSATLVAVTVMLCCDVTLDGAVYNPLVLMVPTVGFRLHVTAVLPDPPVTEEENCWV